MRGFQHQVGERVGHILAVLVGPAQLDVGGVAQQQAGDVEDRLFIGQDAGGRVALVIGQQQHVQPAQRAAAVVHARGDLVPEDPLAGLPEGARGLGDQAMVDVGHLLQVAAQLGVAPDPPYAGLPRQCAGSNPDAQYHIFQAV